MSIKEQIRAVIERLLEFDKEVKTDYYIGRRDAKIEIIAILDTLPEQKPAEWSEEDENALKYLNELISFGYTEKFFDAQTAADMKEWVNEYLRPSWKPSEEQMKALQCAIVFMEIRKAFDYDISPLKSLYEQLQKLIEQ